MQRFFLAKTAEICYVYCNRLPKYRKIRQRQIEKTGCTDPDAVLQ